MKKYIANSDISVSVILPNGEGTRISFSTLSNGTSVFYTSDKDIQWALERHYKFGKLFRLAEETPDEKSVPTKKQNKVSAPKTGKRTRRQEKSVDSPGDMTDKATEGVEEQDDDMATESSDADNASRYREVVVSDMDAAKDYLADQFDVVRTKLKSEESIREAALSFGIVFKYL